MKGGDINGNMCCTTNNEGVTRTPLRGQGVAATLIKLLKNADALARLQKIIKEDDMTHYVIRTPIWNGGKRCVGLNVQLLHGMVTTFEITYVTKKQNKRTFPYRFSVPTAVVYGCPRQTVSGGVVLALVPLDKCTEVRPLGVGGNDEAA